MLHLIFCSLSSLTCQENIFIKVSVLWFALLACQVWPVLYTPAKSVHCAAPYGCRKCAVQSVCKQEVNMHLKLTSGSKILKRLKPIVSCELWLTCGWLKSSWCSILCYVLQIHSHCKVSVELQSDKSVKWIFSVFAGGLSTCQDNVHECKSNTACPFLACLFPHCSNNKN